MFKSLIIVHCIAIVALGNTQRIQRDHVAPGTLARAAGYPGAQKNDGGQPAPARGSDGAPPTSVEASTARLYISRVVPERYRASYPYVIDVDNKEQSSQNNSVHDYADFAKDTGTETRNPSVFVRDEDVRTYPGPEIEGKTPGAAWSDVGSASVVPVTHLDRYNSGAVPVGTHLDRGNAGAAPTGTQLDRDNVGAVPAPGEVTLQDRGAFEASQCPTGTVRIKGKCVTPD